jgi:hypothetical protein
MGARGGKATAGNGGSRKNHHDDSAEAQTNSHRCSRSIGDPQGLTKQGWAAPKGKPTEREPAALIAIVLRRIVLRRPLLSHGCWVAMHEEVRRPNELALSDGISGLDDGGRSRPAGGRVYRFLH